MTERTVQGDSRDGDKPEREEIADQRFSSERVVLDGKYFEDRTFDTCTRRQGRKAS